MLVAFSLALLITLFKPSVAQAGSPSNAHDSERILPSYPTSPNPSTPTAVLGWLTISSTDTKKAARFFQNMLGMVRVADLRVRLPKGNSLLLPTTHSVRMVLLNMPGSDVAGIRLVEVNSPGRELIRKGARPGDYGFFDIGFLAEDTASIHDRFVAAGYNCKDVVEYPVPPLAPLVIHESLCEGPDGILVVFLQRNPPTENLHGLHGSLHSARVVPDADRSSAFFREALGFEFRGEFLYDNDAVRYIVDLPQKGKLRILSIQGAHATGGRLLLFELFDDSGRKMVGKDLKDRETPDHAGLYLWSFMVADLARTVRDSVARGATLICKPRRYGFPPYNGRLAATVQAPDGARLELVEAP